MSEISKVFKQYGDTAGRMYLTLYHSFSTAVVEFAAKKDDKGLAAYKTRFDQYVRKKFGNDFYSSYDQFVKANHANTKLLNELESRHGEFTSKAVLDLAKATPSAAQETGNKPPENRTVPVKENAKQTPVSRHASVSIKGLKADFDYDRPDQALPLVKSATFLQPHDADNWCVLGDLYTEKKDWKSALTCYEKALSKNPKSTRALTGKVKAEHQLTGQTGESFSKAGTETRTAVPKQKEEPAVEEESFYFENEQEFIIYCKTKKNNKNVTWKKGSNYIDEYQRGYKLIDQKQYLQAIEAFKNALKLNPIGLASRFEMCTAYCQVKKYDAAREILDSTIPYLYADILVAKYYRCLGYVLVDEKDYRLAANVYQYSLFFDANQPTVKQELLYIVNEVGFDVLDGIKDRNKVERVLKSAGVPLLTPVV